MHASRPVFSPPRTPGESSASANDNFFAVVRPAPASGLGGGKFANGAVTAAFGYLYNYCESHPCSVDAQNAEGRARTEYQFTLRHVDDDHVEAMDEVEQSRKVGEILDFSLDLIPVEGEAKVGVESVWGIVKDAFHAVFQTASSGPAYDEAVDRRYTDVLNDEMDRIDLDRMPYVPIGPGVKYYDEEDEYRQ